MAYEHMYDYYGEQTVLPTYSNFLTPDDLAAHNQHRHDLFTDKLALPSRMFRGADLIEFGPDSGENSLVFAQWGAGCSLVEPNIKAHPIIKEYFSRYGISDKLVSLEASDIAAYAAQAMLPKRYDFIDAEGFIYTVKPNSMWIDLFGRLLKPDGFVVLFYCEAFGSFLENVLKVIHAYVRRKTGLDPDKAARMVFQAKWDSIPHRRTMTSWIMDVLENPFVRLAYYLEPIALCEQMNDAGLRLYSSWPSYRDSLNVYWFKKSLTANEQLAGQNRFISQSRLSHLFGRGLFLVQPDPVLEKALFELLALTDGLIDAISADKVAQCVSHLSLIEAVVASSSIIATDQDRRDTLRAVNSVKRIFELVGQDMQDELVRFCSTDEAFIKVWGTPSHFAVFRLDQSA